MDNEKLTQEDLEYGVKTEKCENDTQTLQYREYDEKHCKRQKMRNAHCNTAGYKIWRETLKKLENEKCKMQNLEYGQKTENYGKLETQTVGRNMVGNNEKLKK